MALSRAAKQSLADDYGNTLAQARHAFVLGYQGIKVSEVTNLRHRIRGAGGSYQVVKNRIALRAIQGTPLEPLSQHFKGPTGVAYSRDPVALAKALTDFAKTVPAITFKGAVVDGQPVAGSEVQAIANLPSREELIAKLLYLMQSPVAGLVRSLAAITRQFVVVVDQVRQHKEGPA